MADQQKSRFRDPGLIAGIVVLLALFFSGLQIPSLVGLGAFFALQLLMRKQAAALHEELPEGLYGIGLCLSVVLPCCLCYWLLTHGAGVLLAEDLLSHAFDSLAEGLLAGTAQVDPDAIRWEASVYEGRSYMYFGPFPALLRIPLNLVAGAHAGHWSRLSCFLASTIGLVSFAHLCASMLIKNRDLDADETRHFLITSVLGFGLASPLVFLSFAASIYHESMLWGLAGSLAFMALLLPRLDSPEALRDALPGLATVAGATLLSRATFGGPLYVILFLATAWLLIEASRVSSQELIAEARLCIIYLLPAVFLLVFQLWYNYDRYGSIFTFVQYDWMGFMARDPEAMSILQEKGKFNLQRVLPAMSNYFGVKREFFSSEFPWFRIVPPHYPDLDLYPRLFQSYLISLSVSASWLVLGAGFGLLHLLRGRRSPLTRWCALAFFAQFLLVSSYYIMEERYAVDLLPFMIFGYMIFLTDVAGRGLLAGRSKDVVSVLIFFVAMSGIITSTSTLSAIPVSGPGLPNAYKAEWGERFRAINASVNSLRGD